MKLSSIPILLSLPASISAYINGRCSGRYNDGACICIDHDLCVNTYGGRAYAGSPGDYPCPYDPNNIIGCEIYPCPGYYRYTECLFKEGCDSVGGTPLAGKFPWPASRSYYSHSIDPVCPGGANYFCCDFSEYSG